MARDIFVLTKKIILLSGPSCVGKTPLIASFKRTHPYTHFGRPVLWTSRLPRPFEKEGVDYFFHNESEIRALPEDRFIVAKTRHVWQAIDLDEFEHLCADFDLIIYDIHPLLVQRLLAHERATRLQAGIRRVFLQPATIEELEKLARLLGDVSLSEAAVSIMSPKLTLRAQQQGIELDDAAVQDISIRAAAAWKEIEMGQSYEHIIINHDGEDCANWKENPPRGEAGRTLREFVRIVNL